VIDLRQLRHFVAVAEELHFRRAAARLAMSQPPLTASVRRLEQEVGTRLIERGNRTMRLTPAGAAFLEEARHTLRQAEQAVAAARAAGEGRVGALRLAYVGSALYGRLPGLIRLFRQDSPAVRLELREATSMRQVAMLREGLADLGVLHAPPPDGADLDVRPFDWDRLVMALPRAHRLATAEMSLADLADEPFVLWPAREGRGFHQRAMRLCAGAGFAPDIVHEAHGMHAVLSLVAVGAGVALVPGSMAGFRADEVVYRAIAVPEARFERVLCQRTGDASPVAGRFIAMVAAAPR